MSQQEEEMQDGVEEAGQSHTLRLARDTLDTTLVCVEYHSSLRLPITHFGDQTDFVQDWFATYVLLQVLVAVERDQVLLVGDL